MFLWKNIYLSKRVRWSDFLQAIPLRPLYSMSLAGQSPTIPLVFPCNLFLSDHQSVVCPVQALSCFLPTLAACMLSECVLCQQVRCWNTVVQDKSSLGLWCILSTTMTMRLRQGADKFSCTDSTCKALPAGTPRTKARWSIYLWQTLNRKAFCQSLSHALACYGTCSHFLT